MAEASHEFEVVSEQLNDARVVLAEHQTAGEAVVAAEGRLAALDGQIRQLAQRLYRRRYVPARRRGTRSVAA